MAVVVPVLRAQQDDALSSAAARRRERETNQGSDASLRNQIEQLVDGDRNRAKELFAALDRDDSGEIDTAELKAAAEKLVKVTADGSVHEMVKADAIGALQKTIESKVARRQGYCECFVFIAIVIMYYLILTLQGSTQEIFNQRQLLERVTSGTTLTKKTIATKEGFYAWLDEFILKTYTAPPCGDGRCTHVEHDIPSFSRFGCEYDCGLFGSVTRVRVDLAGRYERESTRKNPTIGANICPAGTLVETWQMLGG